MSNNNEKKVKKDISVTSYNQKGGTTAGEVNYPSRSQVEGNKRVSGIPVWLKLLVAIFSILGVIAAIVFSVINL